MWEWLGYMQKKNPSVPNLLPALPEINRSKSDNLPSLQYLEPICGNHFTFLREMRSCQKSKAWEKIAEPYLSDLRFSYKELTESRTAFERHYRAGVEPLFQLAANQGFPRDWCWG